MNKKYILICSRGRYVKSENNYFFQEGDGFYLQQISNEFDKGIILAHKVNDDCIQNETFNLDSNVICLDRGKTVSLFSLNLIKIIKNAELIYVFYPLKSSILIALISKIFQKKIIGYNGGVWSEMKLQGSNSSFQTVLKKQYFNFLEYLSIRLCDVCIVNNNKLFQKYSTRNELIKASPLLKITRDQINTRDDTCNQKKINLICVSHVKPGKNILELLVAFKILIEKSTSHLYELTIVGTYRTDSEYSQLVFDYIKKNNLENLVQVTGIINDQDKLLEYYRNADILLLVTNSEGFPRVIWEAFSQSLPVICSSIYNIVSEFSSEDIPVNLLKYNTPEIIVKNIEYLVSNKDIRKNLIKMGLDIYLEKTALAPIDQFRSLLERFGKLNKKNSKI